MDDSTRKTVRGLGTALLAGAAGGVAGGWAMNRVVQWLSPVARLHGAQAVRRTRTPPDAVDKQRTPAALQDSTMKVARMAAEELGAIRSRVEGRRDAGKVVHYTFAAAAGAAYGVATEYTGVSFAGAGLVYSAALWFGADFVVLPATGLSRSAPEYGWRVEALSLLGHLAYGAVLHKTQRVIRRIVAVFGASG